jgi:hypothetical protein
MDAQLSGGAAVSVRFDVSGGSTKGVDMSNGTARIVLALLGQGGNGYLEGELPVTRVRALLASVTPEALMRAAVLPRVVGPNCVDHGTSLEWLESRVAGLRALVDEAVRAGKTEIVWR